MAQARQDAARQHRSGAVSTLPATNRTSRPSTTVFLGSGRTAMVTTGAPIRTPSAWPEASSPAVGIQIRKLAATCGSVPANELGHADGERADGQRQQRSTAMLRSSRRYACGIAVHR